MQLHWLWQEFIKEKPKHSDHATVKVLDMLSEHAE